ncbi:hypothetical protein QOZ80_8AG0635530 [Eleusine coracana subsp. coracana]|nr:hypothetical protein QOZ80_8AG0635530 [Eleusine coracana subsp. coracana]
MAAAGTRERSGAPALAAASTSSIGTCNGFLCLHESWKVGGVSFSAITVINPITGEKQELPPVPVSCLWEQFRNHGKYTFGYHPTTGQYKVVHIPWAPRQEVDPLLVFTLGDASWRKVPVVTTTTLKASYDRLSGAVTVDGWTYWLTAFTDRVMALDLEHERVAAISLPQQGTWPASIPGGPVWQLTSVHGRLGIVVTDCTIEAKEIWVLEGRGDQQPRWSKWYNLILARRWPERWILAPHLMMHGAYILSQSWDILPQLDGFSFSSYHRLGRRHLYRHNVDCKDGQLVPLSAAELVMSEKESNGKLVTFEYVETLEPLPRFIDDGGGDNGGCGSMMS